MNLFSQVSALEIGVSDHGLQLGDCKRQAADVQEQINRNYKTNADR